MATLLLAMWSAPSSIAHAQQIESGHGNATSRVLVYSDDDATTVVTSTVDARTAVGASVEVGAHALVDVVSSASVDVVTAATERWQENRIEVGARARAAIDGSSVSLGYTRSQENDWLSNAVSIGGSRELFQRNTVVSASYAVVLNTVGRASDPNFERSLQGHNWEVSVSQLVDRKTRVGAAYTMQYLSGYMSSPYRNVSAMDGASGRERHPDSRARHALTGYAVRSLADFVAGRVSYRLYADDWGVRAHTASVGLSFEFGDRWSAGTTARVYTQNQADFYRAAYATNLRHMTADRELSTFWDVGGSGNIGVVVGPVTATAKMGAIYYRFKNFPALRKRTALIASGGLEVNW